MPAWVWFTIAGVAAVVGAGLLVADHGRRTAHSRERRRWASLRGWQFVESDPVLPDRWHHGGIGQGGARVATDLVSGRLFTAESRRLVHAFDLVQNGKVATVIVAVQRHETHSGAVVEMWLPSVPSPSDAGLDSLGPVGVRDAFVTDLSVTRRMITPELVGALDEIGDDIPVAWFEEDWVLAAAPAGATPARLERLLRALGEVADQLDGSGTDGGDTDGGEGG
ncbi:MAG: hypothetical protein M3R63_04005, partial [Actinomycetota bacterium]|nr:hypothetical protein [Actinomycetota bacterium]